MANVNMVFVARMNALAKRFQNAYKNNPGSFDYYLQKFEEGIDRLLTEYKEATVNVL